MRWVWLRTIRTIYILYIQYTLFFWGWRWGEIDWGSAQTTRLEREEERGCEEEERKEQRYPVRRECSGGRKRGEFLGDTIQDEDQRLGGFFKDPCSSFWGAFSTEIRGRIVTHFHQLCQYTGVEWSGVEWGGWGVITVYMDVVGGRRLREENSRRGAEGQIQVY